MQSVSVLVQENFSAEHKYSQNTISPHSSTISPLDFDWGENIVDRAYKLNLVDEVDSSQSIYSLPTIAIRSRRTTCFHTNKKHFQSFCYSYRCVRLSSFSFFAWRMINCIHTHITTFSSLAIAGSSTFLRSDFEWILLQWSRVSYCTVSDFASNLQINNTIYTQFFQD